MSVPHKLDRRELEQARDAIRAAKKAWAPSLAAVLLAHHETITDALDNLLALDESSDAEVNAAGWSTLPAIEVPLRLEWRRGFSVGHAAGQRALFSRLGIEPASESAVVATGKCAICGGDERHPVHPTGHEFAAASASGGEGGGGNG